VCMLVSRCNKLCTEIVISVIVMVSSLSTAGFDTCKFLEVCEKN
jgi:hypothetical protein